MSQLQPTITIVPSFGDNLSTSEKLSNQTLQVITTNVENTQSVTVGLGTTFSYTQQMANNFAIIVFPTSDLQTLSNGQTYAINASVANIIGDTAQVTYNFSVGDTTPTGIGISGITIKDEGTTVGTAGSVTSIDFVGPNVTATASGAGSTITISGGAGTVGIQSGGVLVGAAGTINFAGSGIGTVSVANDIAIITVSGDYGEFGDS